MRSLIPLLVLLVARVATAQPDGKYRLEAGDRPIVIPGLRISVSGEVHEPGIYVLFRKSQDKAQSALEAAGGTKATAALHRVQLIRPSLRRPIEFDMAGTPRPTFEDGDTLFVPPQVCIVLGGAEKHKRIVLTGNETLFDVVSASGAEGVRLDQVTVIRAADLQSGAEKREIYNLEEANQKIPIYDGDVISIQPLPPPPPYNYRLSQPGL